MLHDRVSNLWLKLNYRFQLWESCHDFTLGEYTMADDRGDFVAPPWWKTPSIGNDYTRGRTGVSTTYTSPDDIIGRKDTNKFTLTTSDATTVSGTPGTVLR